MIFNFTRETTTNLDTAKDLEWLEFNTLGGYSASTILGLNTRREHGLFCVPHGKDGNIAVLLSKLEESAFVENRLHEISSNDYVGSTFPEGYRYIENFSLNPFPTTRFLIEDRILEKTVFLLRDRNVLVVRYELKNQGKPLKLIIKPFLSVRNNHELTTEIQGLNTDSYQGQNFVRWAPKVNLPELNVQFNRGEFIPATLWYHNFTYVKDSRQGTSSREDLFNPGFFQTELKAYETLDLFMSSEPIDDMRLDYEYLYRKTAERVPYLLESKSPEWFIQKQAHQLMKNKAGIIPLSVFHTRQHTREILFALQNMAMVPGHEEVFARLFNGLLDSVQGGLLPEFYKSNVLVRRVPHADLPLWLFPAIYHFVQNNKKSELLSSEINEKLKSIISTFTKGTYGNIYTDKDGLLFSGDHNTVTSWLPVYDKSNKVVRFGYLLEINALWYNALKVMEDLYRKIGKNRQASKYAKQAVKMAKAFRQKFLIEDGALLYDYVNHENKSAAFGINQLLPLVLPFTPMDDAQARRILIKVEDELLTPFGVRIRQKPDSESGEYPSPLHESVWPWTIALYVMACQRYKTTWPEQNREVLEYFKPLFGLLKSNLVGFLPERVYLNQRPYQYGIHNFGLSLSSVAWVIQVLSNHTNGDSHPKTP